MVGLGIALALALAGGASATTYRVLMSFNGSDGANPCGGLALLGNTLYGITAQGGTSSNGVIFRVNTDGTSYVVLKRFNGSDGRYAQGGVVVEASTLYGTTAGGGDGNNGVVFKVNADGSGYAVLKSFTGGEDGANPFAGLVLDGSTLYGTTQYGGNGGSLGYGVVFKVNTDGSGYTVLKSFTGGEDGAYPCAALALSGGTLYGTTDSGGDSHDGVVFKMDTDGLNYAVLKSFTGADGASPWGGLVLAGGTLYGTTSAGGNLSGAPLWQSYGVVFSVKTDGAGYTVLRDFAGQDGETPDGRMVSEGGTLYGTTRVGGSLFQDPNYKPGDGVVFRVNGDGSGYAVLHSFKGADGMLPAGQLLLVGTMLYGTTCAGGDYDCGVVFGLDSAVATPPLLLTVPQGQSMEQGGTAVFSATVANLEPVAYQWLFNGTNALPGATNSSLQLAGLSTGASGRLCRGRYQRLRSGHQSAGPAGRDTARHDPGGQLHAGGLAGRAGGAGAGHLRLRRHDYPDQHDYDRDQYRRGRRRAARDDQRGQRRRCVPR